MPALRWIAMTLAWACAGACAARSSAPVVPTMHVDVHEVDGSPIVVGPATPSAPAPPPEVEESPGELVEVEWHGAWYRARVLERRVEGWLIHYEGYGPEWDEVVGPDRIREISAAPEDDVP